VEDGSEMRSRMPMTPQKSVGDDVDEALEMTRWILRCQTSGESRCAYWFIRSSRDQPCVNIASEPLSSR